MDSKSYENKLLEFEERANLAEKRLREIETKLPLPTLKPEPGDLVIFSYPGNPNAFKALIAARFGTVWIEYPSFEMGKDNKKPEFLELNPLGKVPVLKTPQGAIFESNAIARYVARVGRDSTGLLGATPYEQSLVDQWISFCESYVEPTMYKLWMFHYGIFPFKEQDFQELINHHKRVWQWLETHFSKNKTKFLVSDRITLADIVLGCNYANPVKYTLDKQFRKDFPQAESYFKALYESNEFKSVFGVFPMIEKFNPPH